MREAGHFHISGMGWDMFGGDKYVVGVFVIGKTFPALGISLKPVNGFLTYLTSK